jgi:hypothetical protein
MRGARLADGADDRLVAAGQRVSIEALVGARARWPGGLMDGWLEHPPVPDASAPASSLAAGDASGVTGERRRLLARQRDVKRSLP